MAYQKQFLLDFPIGSNPPLAHTDLGKALKRYVTEGSPEYDPAFKESIKARHPNWFGLPLILPKPKPKRTPNNIVVKKIKSEVG